jgi:hypothetical protein
MPVSRDLSDDIILCVMILNLIVVKIDRLLGVRFHRANSAEVYRISHWHVRFGSKEDIEARPRNVRFTFDCVAKVVLRPRSLNC